MGQNSDGAVLGFFLSMCISAVVYVLIVSFLNSRKRPPGEDSPKSSDQVTFG